MPTTKSKPKPKAKPRTKPMPRVDVTAVRIEPGDYPWKSGYAEPFADAIGTLHNVALGMANLTSMRYNMTLKSAYYTVVVALRDVFLSMAIIDDNMDRESFDTFTGSLCEAAEKRWIAAHEQAAKDNVLGPEQTKGN